MGLLFSVFYLCFGHAYCRSISIFVCQSVLNGPPYLFHIGGIKEKPLVLHSKVKSSGYTSSPRQDHRVSFCLIENQIIITVNSNERENVITFFIFLGFLYFHTTVGRASPRTAYIKMYHTCYKTYLQNSRYHNARFTEHLTLKSGQFEGREATFWGFCGAPRPSQQIYFLQLVPCVLQDSLFPIVHRQCNIQKHLETSPPGALIIPSV